MGELTGFRFAPDYRTAGQLDDSFDVGNLTRPADMPDMQDWDVLGDNDNFDLTAETVIDMVGAKGGFGGNEFEWVIFVSSPGMADRIRRDWFGKTDDSEGRLWTECTVLTRDSTFGDDWRYVQAICHYPGRQERRREGDGWLYTFKFLNGSKAPKGADLTISTDTDPTPPTTGSESVITVTVSNDLGDYQTTAPVVVLYHFPTRLDFVSLTPGSGWVAEYSIDGVTWDDELPVDPVDVRHIRLTRAATLAAGADAPDIELEVIANATGSAVSLWTVSMTGEFRTDNNTHTDSYTIVA